MPLEEQERGLWNAAHIREGLAWLDDALARRDAGPFQLQGAIAALHARAATAADTDWPQIAALSAALHRLQPTAIVELSAAVATAMAEGLDVRLRWIDAIAARGELADYHLVAAERAYLERRLREMQASA